MSIGKLASALPPGVNILTAEKGDAGKKESTSLLASLHKIDNSIMSFTKQETSNNAKSNSANTDNSAQLGFLSALFGFLSKVLGNKTQQNTRGETTKTPSKTDNKPGVDYDNLLSKCKEGKLCGRDKDNKHVEVRAEDYNKASPAEKEKMLAKLNTMETRVELKAKATDGTKIKLNTDQMKQVNSGEKPITEFKKKGFWEKIGDGFKSVGKGIANLAKKAVNYVKDFGTNFLKNPFKAIGKLAGDCVKGAGKLLKSIVVDPFISIGKGIGKIAKGDWKGLLDVGKGALEIALTVGTGGAAGAAMAGGKAVGKGVIKAAGKESAEAASKEAAKASAKEASKAAAKQASKEASEAGFSSAAKYQAKNLGKGATQGFVDKFNLLKSGNFAKLGLIVGTETGISVGGHAAIDKGHAEAYSHFDSSPKESSARV
jgi:hypothetical protein